MEEAGRVRQGGSKAQGTVFRSEYTPWITARKFVIVRGFQRPWVSGAAEAEWRRMKSTASLRGYCCGGFPIQAFFCDPD
jgi:hypothetical protein